MEYEHGIFEIHDSNRIPLRDASGGVVRFFSRTRAERFRPVSYGANGKPAEVQRFRVVDVR